MTGWIIFGSIVLVLILILIQSVHVAITYEKELELKVNILFITLYKMPADPRKKKKKKKKKAKKEKPDKKKAEITDANGTDSGGDSGSADNEGSSESSTAPEGKKQKKKPGFDLNMIMDYVRSAAPPVKRLFKKIRIRNVYIDWVIGSDDAAKTALKYGRVCSAVYSLLEFMKTYLDVKTKEVNIEADFTAEKDDMFIYAEMRLRISTILGVAIWLGWRMLKTYLKYNDNKAGKGSGHKGPQKGKRKKAAPARAAAK